MEENSLWHYMELEKVTPQELDLLLADGWRHFGCFFFRDKINWLNGNNIHVIPLRINLNKFVLSKSHKKILKQNTDIQIIFRDAFIDAEKEAIFHKHCTRFTQNVPNSLYDFLSLQPAFVPCRTMECCLYEGNKLYAVSFLDIGENSTSSVYAMFDPAFSKRSPGIHTLLAELGYSIQNKKSYLYTGYAYHEASHYDYKKRFKGTEFYNWAGKWADLAKTQ